jgi:hypothetical protein
MARPHAAQRRSGGRDSPLQTSQYIASRLKRHSRRTWLVIGARAILDERHDAVCHVISPLACGRCRVGVPAVRLRFVVNTENSLPECDAEGGEPMPVLRLRLDLPAPATDPFGVANGVPQSAWHGVLLDEAA